MHTLNGPTTADKAIDFWLPALSINISALVLKDSPNALSVGKIVRESGLDFLWRHQDPDAPAYVLPDGSVVEHAVKFDTPSMNILDTKVPSLAAEFDILEEDDEQQSERKAIAQRIEDDPKYLQALEPGGNNTESPQQCEPSSHGSSLRADAFPELHLLTRFLKNLHCPVLSHEAYRLSGSQKVRRR